MADIDQGLWINYMLSLLLKRIVVPSDFHSQCDAVEEMLRDDVSGLVDTLTDFAVDSASVKFTIESKNEDYNKIINDWLETINIDFNGKITPGVNALSREYYKERWKGSSFPVLKLSGWKRQDNLILPTKMFFVDGSTIHAKKKDEKKRHLLNYDYYLGSKDDEEYKLDSKDIIFSRPYGRWFDKYPVPYLIKRGIYHNWKIISSLKDKQTKILDQLIPLLLLIKKGSPELVRENIKAGYSDEELTEIKNRMQEMLDEFRATSLDDKTIKKPIRVTNFDEELKYLIPDVKSMFDKELSVVPERNILSALGFVDVIEATSTSRRESILNPKAFIEETKSGVNGFREILQQVMYRVKEENKSHNKYMNVNYYIIHSPVTAFATDDFKEKMRQLYDRGRLSSQTAVELIAEVDFETEVIRREREDRDGIQETLYPVVTQNREGEGIDLPSDFGLPKKQDTDEEDIPDDKKDKVEKQNYNISEKEKDLEIAPYQTIKDLPTRVKKNLSPSLQSVFLRVFNRAYETYKNDSKAFRIAWGVIKKIAKKNKRGVWVKKASKVKITEAVIKEVLSKEETDAIENAIKEKEIEIKTKQSQLLDKLLKKSKE